MSATGGDAKIKSWTPAVPVKIPDNIVSSKFTTAKVFVPSYERDPRPCIEQLLTNEYQRIWWQEKEAWDKKVASKAGTKTLMQRAVIRRKAPTRGKELKLPPKPRKGKTKKKTSEKVDDAKEETVEKEKQEKQKETNVKGEEKKDNKDEEKTENTVEKKKEENKG